MCRIIRSAATPTRRSPSSQSSIPRAKSSGALGWTTSGAPFGVSSPNSPKAPRWLWRLSEMATPRPPWGWYWIVDEIEEASCLPRMAHAHKAKVMMGNVDTRAGYLRQDRQARRTGLGHPSPQWHASHRLAPSGGDPRPAGAPPHPHGLLAPPHRHQESHPRDRGQVRPYSPHQPLLQE
jgi:hypothetical protein